MKKRIYVLPCVLAGVMLMLAVLLICQALFAKTMLPFVGHGGRYNKLFKSLLGIPHHYFVMLLGAIISVAVAFLRRKKYGLNVWQTALFGIVFPFWAWIGTKCLFGFEKVIVQKNFLAFDPSGQSLYGGIIFAALYVVVMSFCFKKSKVMLFDFVAPLGMIVVTGARLACFFSGCCGAPLRYVGVRAFYLPVQLFEVVLDLLLLAFLLYLEQNKLTWGQENEKGSAWNGNQALIIMVCYGTYRFILEFLRDNPRFWLNMSLPQYYSIICVAIGTIVLFKRKQAHDWMLEKQKRHAQKHPGRR
ncbi:MAG: prolipoprotein diacylglyceryl transferase [Clostridia bacterium]|nr:prolipoprotein diacylglyceryl transferase [Clostridia bacterium]